MKTNPRKPTATSKKRTGAHRYKKVKARRGVGRSEDEYALAMAAMQRKHHEMDTYIGMHNAVEWFFVEKLSAKELKSYLKSREIDEETNEFFEDRELLLERLSNIMRKLGFRADPEFKQFTFYDLHAIQHTLQTVIESERRFFQSGIENSKRKIDEAKWRGTRERDPKLSALFCRASEIYIQGRVRYLLGKGKVSWEEALTAANTQGKFVAENFLRVYYDTINRHFRKWRTRNSATLSRIERNLMKRLVGRAVLVPEAVTTIKRIRQVYRRRKM